MFMRTCMMPQSLFPWIRTGCKTLRKSTSALVKKYHSHVDLPSPTVTGISGYLGQPVREQSLLVQHPRPSNSSGHTCRSRLCQTPRHSLCGCKHNAYISRPEPEHSRISHDFHRVQKPEFLWIKIGPSFREKQPIQCLY